MGRGTKEIITTSGEVLYVQQTFKDLTGERVGRLSVNGVKYKKDKYYIYECTCDCGNVVEVNKRELIVGDTKSCGCFKAEVQERNIKEFTEKYKTHGLSGTREQKAWKRVKQRVCNPNHADYPEYSLRGMVEEWKEDFTKFFEHIGEIPDDRPRWSVGRIDNDIGYFPGNVRWERDDEQSKNKGKYKNNSTGYTGVYPHKIKGVLKAYAASWYTLEKKQVTKYFFITKDRDEELALLCAVECRDQAMRLLKQQGAAYSDKHGL